MLSVKGEEHQGPGHLPGHVFRLMTSALGTMPPTSKIMVASGECGTPAPMGFPHLGETFCAQRAGQKGLRSAEKHASEVDILWLDMGQVRHAVVKRGLEPGRSMLQLSWCQRQLHSNRPKFSQSVGLDLIRHGCFQWSAQPTGLRLLGLTPLTRLLPGRQLAQIPWAYWMRISL